MQLPILESYGGRINGVGRGPRSSCGSCVGKLAVALAKAGLVTLLEVLMLDGDCREGELSGPRDEWLDVPAGRKRQHSAVQSRKTAVHRGAVFPRDVSMVANMQLRVVSAHDSFLSPTCLRRNARCSMPGLTKRCTVPARVHKM